MDEHTGSPAGEQPESTPPPPPSGSPSPAPAAPPPLKPPVPPVMSPPKANPSRPPSQPRSGWWWFGVFLLGFLGLGGIGLLVVASIFGSLFSSAFSLSSSTRLTSSEHGPHLQEVVKQDGDSRHRILVIPVEGVISSEPIESVGHTLVELIRDELDKAAEDKTVKAVILKVDSPGGEVLASDEIYKLFEDFQEKSDKPIVVSMGNLAASGGYYISVPCRWIVANELTITGSIGVIMHGMNYRGLMDKVGLRPEVFKSGRFKDMLSGDKREEDISKEERDMVQKMVNDTFGRFKEVVATGRQRANKLNSQNKAAEDRGRNLVSDWANYADGRILSGKDAQQLGFVDELGNFETAVERVKQLVDLEEDPEIFEFHPILDFSHLLRFLGQNHAKPMKVDLGVEPPKLKSGYMYFVWPLGLN